MEGNGRLELDPLVGNRALAAWLLSTPARAGPAPGGQRPSAYLCQHDSHRYAVVTSTSTSTDVLAVYRIHPDGTLVRLDRWPEEIESYLSAHPGRWSRALGGPLSQRNALRPSHPIKSRAAACCK